MRYLPRSALGPCPLIASRDLEREKKEDRLKSVIYVELENKGIVKIAILLLNNNAGHWIYWSIQC